LAKKAIMMVFGIEIFKTVEKTGSHGHSHISGAIPECQYRGKLDDNKKKTFLFSVSSILEQKN
jgi:hypothetical protein